MKESTEQNLQFINYIEILYVLILGYFGLSFMGDGIIENKFGISSIGGVLLALSMACYCARLMILKEGNTIFAMVCFFIQLVACVFSGVTILIQFDMGWFSILGILLSPIFFIIVMIINIPVRMILMSIRMALVSKDHFGQ